MSNFDIIIKDNFIEKNLFEELKNKIPYLKYNGLGNYLKNEKGSHVWFSAPVENKIENIIKEKCEKTLNKKFKVPLCCYTMLGSHEPLVHSDNSRADYQAIIYIKGDTNLNKGTGFYVFNKETNSHELNTHVGFYENRAIIWDSNIFHSPMNWSSDNKSFRFSIIIQLKNYEE